MRRKPCLIFGHYPLNLTDGGPSGFLAQNVVGMESRYFDFFGRLPSGRRSLSARLSHARGAEPNRTIRRMGFEAPSPLATEMYGIRAAFLDQGGPLYKWVWFHDVLRLAACIDLLADGQKVILQSHSPELPSVEFRNAGANESDVRWVVEAESKSFERTNIYVAPNDGALDPTRHLIGKKTRVEFLLSGSRKLVPRTQIPLDKDCIYFLYIGRRIWTKGYDLVIDAFRAAHEMDPTLRLILIGDGIPESSDGIIDVGRTEDPASWLASCDWLISANRESYFDLVVMEALSIGTPIVMTVTGGHEFFATDENPGVKPMADTEVRTLTESMMQNRVKRSGSDPRVAENISLHSQIFSVDRYRDRLNAFFERIL